MKNLDTWPRITNELKEAVLRQLNQSISIYDRSGIFEEFENNISKYFGVRYSLLFNSGTEALHALYFATGIHSGSNVICPNNTFFATATPLLHLNSNIHFIDCDDTGNMSAEVLTNSVSSNTDAIIVTHMWGVPCDMKNIVKIANKINAIILEDCSHSHGAKIAGKLVGTFGEGAAFSIQGKKLITGGEGGVLVTNNIEVYEKALLFGHYNKRCKSEIRRDSKLYKFAISGAGLKLRAHPLAIAIANYNLEQMDIYDNIRNKYADVLFSIFNGMKNIVIPPTYQQSIRAWYAFTLYIKNAEKKEELINDLNSYGLNFDSVGSTMPMHNLTLFKDTAELLPDYSGKITFSSINNSDRIYNMTIKCPVSPYIDDLEYLKKNASKIRDKIRRIYE